MAALQQLLENREKHCPECGAQLQRLNWCGCDNENGCGQWQKWASVLQDEKLPHGTPTPVLGAIAMLRVISIYSPDDMGKYADMQCFNPLAGVVLKVSDEMPWEEYRRELLLTGHPVLLAWCIILGL